MGRAQVFLGRVAEGEALLVQTLEECRSLGARKTVIHTLSALGLARQSAGDLDGARLHFVEALESARAIGAERWAAHLALNLAEVEFQSGDAAAALRLADEALPVLRLYGNVRQIAGARYDIGAYLVALRRCNEARMASRDAVTIARDTKFPVGLVFALQHLAAVAASRRNANTTVIEDCRRAARILGYIDARLVSLEALRRYSDQREYDASIPALRDALGDDEVARFMSEGATWSEDQAVAEAMLI